MLSEKKGRVVIRTAGRIVVLDVDEITWMQACSNYVKIFAGNQEYSVRDGIGEVCKALDPKHFVRIHRSTVVNVCKIRELQPCNSGEYIVVLRNGKELSCSRGYRKRLDELIGL
jgi:two-component system LytT family response regulator